MRPPEAASSAQQEERQGRTSSTMLTQQQEDTRPPIHPLANLLASSMMGADNEQIIVVNESPTMRIYNRRLSPPPSPTIESAMLIEGETQQLMLLSAPREDRHQPHTSTPLRGISLMQFTSSSTPSSRSFTLGSPPASSLAQIPASSLERETHHHMHHVYDAERSTYEDGHLSLQNRNVAQYPPLNDEGRFSSQNVHLAADPYHNSQHNIHNSTSSIGSSSSLLSSILSRYRESNSSLILPQNMEEEEGEFDENSPSALAAFFDQLSLATMGSHAQVIFHDDLLSFILSQRVLERSAFADNALVEALQLYLTLPIECNCGIPDDKWTLSSCKCAQRAIWQLKEHISSTPQPHIR